jgi:hypothetical protein
MSFYILILVPSSREPDPGVSEGVNSIIFAAPRTELKGAQVFHPMINVIHSGQSCKSSETFLCTNMDAITRPLLWRIATPA